MDNIRYALKYTVKIELQDVSMNDVTYTYQDWCFDCILYVTCETDPQIHQYTHRLPQSWNDFININYHFFHFSDFPHKTHSAIAWGVTIEALLSNLCMTQQEKNNLLEAFQHCSCLCTHKQLQSYVWRYGRRNFSVYKTIRLLWKSIKYTYI